MRLARNRAIPWVDPLIASTSPHWPEDLRHGVGAFLCFCDVLSRLDSHSRLSSLVVA